jgi:hypothetical protein
MWTRTLHGGDSTALISRFLTIRIGLRVLLKAGPLPLRTEEALRTSHT